MRRFLPFVFPLIAFLIVVGLLYRWYTLRANPQGQISDQASSVEVQPLSTADQTRLNTRGVADLKSVDLMPVASPAPKALPAQAAVRYEVVDGKVNFTVGGTLPALPAGQVYQVWLQSGASASKAFTLSNEKGGWMGSGSINAAKLPVDVVVSQEATQDNTIEQVILKGTLAQ